MTQVDKIVKNFDKDLKIIKVTNLETGAVLEAHCVFTEEDLLNRVSELEKVYSKSYEILIERE